MILKRGLRNRWLWLSSLAVLCAWLFGGTVCFVHAATNSSSIVPGVNLSIGSGSGPSSVADTVKIILLLTVMTLAPAALILMTCFTRVIVVLSFIRNALSLQTTPPNQVLIGLALFITMFVMEPTLQQANKQALQPYLNGKISQTVAMQRAELPFKVFMEKQTRVTDLELFMQYRHEQIPKDVTKHPQSIPLSALVPAYTISELKTAFQIGFMIYLPFLVIDLVVATTLMSMGMMMLPPVVISLPFKILLFVMVDGWYLVVKSLLAGYAT
ncbi:flagellar biosynthetic protein FliP [Alicyclobacillus acidoterrestris]|uniref:flagellar type III secretion system pore protein FliP n=1 Tax=Alicyclobacillus suci TaxID=2816080 RepID=UPI0011975832|nr:flagellar type III secretion system pore protein FliP [Alicyclobacillus suci]GEO24822.1 flagellar biosynthetic protein FliP [Alicyclobacillus acidoterrestris]